MTARNADRHPSEMHSIDSTIRRLARLARTVPALEASYLVGGAVRDALLGRPVRELDIASSAATDGAHALADALGSSVVSLGGQHELYRVPLEGGWIDVTPIQGGLDADLDRRDFTIDALALPLRAVPRTLEGLPRDAVIDRHRGLDDLDAGLVRQVSRSSISEDPVRALRGVRLATTLEFSIEPATEFSIAEAASLLDDVALERVGHELEQLLGSRSAATGFRILERTGLLDRALPELVAGRSISQRPHHTWDVLEHQLVALEWMGVLLRDTPPEAEPAAAIWHHTWDEEWRETVWGPVRAHLEERAPVLRLATLLHDIGKPETRTLEADGRTRFFGHGPRGAVLAAARLRALRFPERVIGRISLLLEQHLRPGQVASPGQRPTPRALHRFHQRLGDAALDVCFLFLADSLATADPEELLPRWPAYVAHVQRIVGWHPPEAARTIAGLVDGHAVIEATGIEPGPEVGRILEEIREAAAAGEITDRNAALDLARQLAG